MSLKWYKKATVQASLVGGIFVVIAAVITGLFVNFNPKTNSYPQEISERIDPKVIEIPFSPRTATDDDPKLLITDDESSKANISVFIESAHTSRVCNLRVSSRISVSNLLERSVSYFKLHTEANVGSMEPFRVRWILVDLKALGDWRKIVRQRKQEIFALVRSQKGLIISKSPYDRLEDIEIYNNIVFRLYAIEDVRYEPSTSVK